MNDFNEIYEINKELDSMFEKNFDVSFDELYRKNKLEFLVEISELANETRVFKYWSKKEPDFEKMMYELADCIIITLSFFNYKNISLDEEFPSMMEYSDSVDLFFKLYDLGNRFYNDDDSNTLKLILVTIMQLSSELNINREDVISYTKSKIERNFIRMKEGF